MISLAEKYYDKLSDPLMVLELLPIADIPLVRILNFCKIILEFQNEKKKSMQVCIVYSEHFSSVNNINL
jgi:hypothetical protein